MTQALKVFYDGKVFKPKEPVNLQPDSEFQIFIEVPERKPIKNKSLFVGLAAMNLSGPSDWSENFEDYLTGAKQFPE